MRTHGAEPERGKEVPAVGRLTRAVLSRDAMQRERAISAILRSPSRSIVGELTKFLAAPDPDLRMTGLSLLKRVGGRNISPVLDLLKHIDPWMRMSGCEILGTLRRKGTIPQLTACSKDADPNVRNAACIALGEFSDDAVVEPLLSALEDEEWIAFSAVCSLGKTGSLGAVPYLWKVFVEKDGVLGLIACEVLLGARYRHVWRDVFLVLGSWSERKREMFVRMVLEKEVPAVLNELYETLGEDLFSHLARHLLENGTWSMELMRLLARFRRAETCDILLAALGRLDEDADLYEDLLLLFSGLHDVWRDRTDVYLEKDEHELLPFIRACGIAHHEIPVQAIDRLFSSGSLAVKRVLIREVPLIAHQDAAALLQRALKDEDGHVKGDAALAAARLGLTHLAEDIADMSLDGFFDVRKKGLQALAILDRERLARLVHELAQSARGEDRKVALTVLDQLDREHALLVLGALLEDPDESVVRSAISAAGKMVHEDERYLALLGRLLAERPVPHELLRVAREQRLGVFKEALVNILREKGSDAWTRYQVLTALAAFRDLSLVGLFLGTLQDESPLIKIGCIKALSDLGDAGAIAHIQPLTKSQDVALRSAANSAVKELRRVEQGRVP